MRHIEIIKKLERDLKIVHEELEKRVEDRTIGLRREIEERNKSMERWQALFENVEEGIIILDKNINIIQMNPAAERFSGFNEREAIGKKYYNIFRCQDTVGNTYPDFCPVEKVCITKESIPYDEHIHQTSSEKNLWVGVSYTPILSKIGEIEQIIGVIRDVTALKEIELAKSEFVSIASHELRTPLTVINGYLSLLISGDIGNASSSSYKAKEMLILNKVFRETKRLIKLVEDLLNVSRIEEGRLKLNLKKADLTKLVYEVVDEYKSQAKVRGINIFVESKLSKNTLPTLVFVDIDTIKQALVNLIDNAFKFTKPGGKVIIRCSINSGSIDTDVIDSGIGINKELLPRLFEKFQQETGNYIKENKGTGLGLFIVKSIIDLHNGSIRVNSIPGKGTTFTFSLPQVSLEEKPYDKLKFS